MSENLWNRKKGTGQAPGNPSVLFATFLSPKVPRFM